MLCCVWLVTTGTSAKWPLSPFSRTSSKPADDTAKNLKPATDNTNGLLEAKVDDTVADTRPTPDVTILNREPTSPGSPATPSPDMYLTRLGPAIEEQSAAVNRLRETLARSDDDISFDELISRVEDVQKQRKNVKMLVMAYTAAQMALMASNYLALTNPIVFSAARAIDYAIKQLVAPLELLYSTHLTVYSGTVEDVLNNYPKFKKYIEKKPKELIIKKKNGQKIVIKVMDNKAAAAANKPLKQMGTMNLMTTAWQM